MKRSFEWANKQPTGGEMAQMDAVFVQLVQDSPNTDRPMMSTSAVSKMVVAKLADYDGRWRNFPQEQMKSDCKAFKCLFNVVNYRLKNLRQQQDPQDGDEAVPVPRLQANEESSEIDHSLRGS